MDGVFKILPAIQWHSWVGPLVTILLIIAGVATVYLLTANSPRSQSVDLVIALYITNPDGKLLIVREGPMHPHPYWTIPSVVMQSVPITTDDNGSLRIDASAIHNTLNANTIAKLGVSVSREHVERIMPIDTVSNTSGHPLYAADILADASGEVVLPRASTADIEEYRWVPRDAFSNTHDFEFKSEPNAAILDKIFEK